MLGPCLRGGPSSLGGLPLYPQAIAALLHPCEKISGVGSEPASQDRAPAGVGTQTQESMYRRLTLGSDSPSSSAVPSCPNPGTLCEVVPSSVALGGPRLALRHLLPDHRARPLGQLPAFAPLHHPVGTHQPEEAEPLRQPLGGAALRAVIRRNHLLQVGPGVWTGPSVPPVRATLPCRFLD